MKFTNITIETITTFTQH